MKVNTMKKLGLILMVSTSLLALASCKSEKKEVDDNEPNSTAEAPKLSHENRLQQIREAWETDRLKRVREMFKEMNTEEQEKSKISFETEELPTLSTPVLRAWKRDGANSRICASSFFRWLAKTTWNEPVTDQMLIEFALSNGIMKLDSSSS